MPARTSCPLTQLCPHCFLSLSTLQPGGKMVAAAKATVPTIADQASAMQLSQCAKNLATALAELRTAAQKVRKPEPPDLLGTTCSCQKPGGSARPGGSCSSRGAAPDMPDAPWRPEVLGTGSRLLADGLPGWEEPLAALGTGDDDGKGLRGPA